MLSREEGGVLCFSAMRDQLRIPAIKSTVVALSASYGPESDARLGSLLKRSLDLAVRLGKGCVQARETSQGRLTCDAHKEAVRIPQ
jgi:hypothetical protein